MSLKLQEKNAGTSRIVKIQPNVVTIEKKVILDSVNIDSISIAHRKNETLLSFSAVRELGDTKNIGPTKTEPETNERIGKKGEIETDHSGQHWIIQANTSKTGVWILLSKQEKHYIPGDGTSLQPVTIPSNQQKKSAITSSGGNGKDRTVVDVAHYESGGLKLKKRGKVEDGLLTV